MTTKFGAQAPPRLLIFGADSGQQVARQGSQVVLRGASDIHKLLDGEPCHRWYPTRKDLRQRRPLDFSPYRFLINLITEPEENGDLLDGLKKTLREAPGLVINRPEAVLKTTRDQVSRRLAGIPGLLAPKVIRFKTGKPDLALQMIERAGLGYPVIVRQAGTHTGIILGRFDSPAELGEALTGAGDHIATEFVDFRSDDGLYRKYRYFFIGRRIIFRHMLVSDSWNIHARDRRRFMLNRPELLDEERSLFDRPQGALPDAVIATLDEVRERMGLDYFGMDFGLMRDGRIVLFEANATMNFFPFLEEPEFAYVQRCLAPARQAFRALIGLEGDAADLRATS